MGRSRFAASARACFASLLSRLFRPRLLPATSRIYACEPLEPVRLAGFGIWFGGIYQIEWSDYANESGNDGSDLWLSMDYSTDTQRITIDWGDGTSDTFDAAHPYELYTQHVYADSGYYTVNIVAEMYTDPTETFQFTAVVNNVDPTANFQSLAPTIDLYEEITLSLTDPHDPSPADNNNLSCSIDWGDGGSPSAGGCWESFTHHYYHPGTFNVTGRITDPDGGFSEYTETVNVRPPAPESVSATLGTTEAGLDKVTVSWPSVPMAQVTGYQVHRAPGASGSFTPTDDTLIADLPATSTSFTDLNLNPTTTYRYFVFAVAGQVQSNAPAPGAAVVPDAIDLDIDSDNTGVIDRTPQEDQIEDENGKPGKTIPLSRADSQAFIAVPATLPNEAMLRFYVQDRTSTPQNQRDGNLQLFDADGIPIVEGQSYSSVLFRGVGAHLGVRALAPSHERGDQRIVVELDEDGGNANFVEADAVRVTVSALDFIDSNNNVISPETQALNVSNYVTTDALPANANWADTNQDPDNFRVQLFDPARQGNASVNIRLVVERGGQEVLAKNYTLDKKGAGADAARFRGEFLRLVTDGSDDAASGAGINSDPKDQTLLVQLGDVVKAQYEMTGLGHWEAILTVGRPASENNNGADQSKHDIRQVKVYVHVFRNRNDTGPSVTQQQVWQDIERANQRFAQSAIKLDVIHINTGGAASPGIALPNALNDGFTVTENDVVVSPTPDELAVMALKDNDPNSVDVFYVDEEAPNWMGTSYPLSGNGTGQQGTQRHNDFQNFVIMGRFNRGPDPFILPHELMHILLDSFHRADPQTAVFVREPPGKGEHVAEGLKRIGPYPAAAAANVGNDDTTTIRARAEALPVPTP